MNLKKIGTRTLTTTPRVRVVHENGAVSYRDGEPVKHDIEVHIDLDALVQRIGRKAVKSKSRKTRLQDGAVTLIAKPA